MNLQLTEQQHKDRIIDLVRQFEAITACIEKLDMRIGGLHRVYSRAFYGSKAKAMREAAQEQYMKERVKLIEERDKIMLSINEHKAKISQVSHAK